MAQEKQKKVFEQAVDFLRRAIAQGVWDKNARLPTATQLSQKIRISRNTMLKAVQVLKKEGILSSRKKRGIFLGTGPDVVPANFIVTKQSFKWESVKQQLIRDVLEGPFHDLEYLPSYKELMVFYGAGFLPIKKAVESIISEGLLHKAGRKIRINLRTQPKAVNKVYLFAHEAVKTFQTWAYDRELINMFFRSLEKECYSRNIALTKQWFSNNKAIDPNASENTLGFILFTNFGNYLQTEYNEIFNQLWVLLKFKRPIVVVNFIDFHKVVAKPLLNFCLKHSIHITNLSFNEEAGFQVGKFLYLKGHRKVCFFGHDSRVSTWQQRYAGLLRAFSYYGLPDAVVPFFALPKDPSVDKQTLSPVIKNAAQYRTLDKRIEILKRLTAAIFKADESIAKDKERLTMPFFEFINGLVLERNWPPLFQKALTIPGATAWVCVEDNLANCAAYEFLKTIKIPKTLGIIGFQDQIESSFNDISSYRFDFAGAAISALNIIIYPRYAEKIILNNDGTTFDLNGMVIDRGSV